MKEVYDLLKQCNHYFIATINDGKPALRPFATLNFYHDRIYFFTDKSKAVSKQIQTLPFVQICGCFDSLWLRIEAEVVEDTSLEAKKAMFEAVPILNHSTTFDDVKSQVFYLKSGQASLYAFTECIKTLSFSI